MSDNKKNKETPGLPYPGIRSLMILMEESPLIEKLLLGAMAAVKAQEQEEFEEDKKKWESVLSEAENLVKVASHLQ